MLACCSVARGGGRGLVLLRGVVAHTRERGREREGEGERTFVSKNHQVDQVQQVTLIFIIQLIHVPCEG